MSQSLNRDWFARTMAILSLFVAIGAIVVPTLTHKAGQRESLDILVDTQLQPFEVKLYYLSRQKEEGLLMLPWRVVLANTGSRKISLVNYDIAIENNASKFQSNDSAMTLIGRNMLFSDSGASIILPFSLDAGESCSLIAYISFIVTSEAIMALECVPPAERSNPSAVIKALNAKGYDIYGNPVQYTECPDGMYKVHIPSIQEISKRVILSFRSSRGSLFYGIAETYSLHDMFRKGPPQPPGSQLVIGREKE